MQYVPVGDLNHSTFVDKANSKFRLHINETQTMELVLNEVGELHTTRWQEYFSIVFLAPDSPILPQRIYKMEHDQIGIFELFLTPIAKDEDGVRYEAVFNHVIKKRQSQTQ